MSPPVSLEKEPRMPKNRDGVFVAEVDTTYQTMQRDFFASGMAAQIGPNAFAVWHAIKWHADYSSGESWPSVRRLMDLTGLASKTVQRALVTLQEALLLRVRKVKNRNYYVARERLDIRLGEIKLCTVVVDYVPTTLRETLANVKSAIEGKVNGEKAKEILSRVDIIPGPGFVFDGDEGVFRRELPQHHLALGSEGQMDALKDSSEDPVFTRRIAEIQAKAMARKKAKKESS